VEIAGRAVDGQRCIAETSLEFLSTGYTASDRHKKEMVTGFAEKRFTSQDLAQESSGIRAVVDCL
jgi:hypothetical protein